MLISLYYLNTGIRIFSADFRRTKILWRIRLSAAAWRSMSQSVELHVIVNATRCNTWLYLEWLIWYCSN